MFKIMVVDDCRISRMMIINILKKNGFDDVMQATDGDEAVAFYKTKHPDLTILDITMPHKDGITALKEIIGYDKSAKIVMMSASGQEEIVMKAIKSGASNYIVKPFTAEKVMQVIHKILDKQIVGK